MTSTAQDAAARLATQVREALTQYERDAAAGAGEVLVESGLLQLARAHASAETPASRLERAEQIGTGLELTEAGMIRQAGKAVEAGLRDLVLNARIDGWEPPEIAANLGTQNSYVYRILREYAWEALYRVEWQDEAGAWVEVDSGLREVTKLSAEQVARDLFLDRDNHDSGRVRVCVWRAGEGNTLDAARCVYPQQPEG